MWRYWYNSGKPKLNDNNIPSAKTNTAKDQSISLSDNIKLIASGGQYMFEGAGENTKSIYINPTINSMYTVKATQGGTINNVFSWFYKILIHLRYCIYTYYQDI